MTPQEQQLVNELFARLAQLESAPRDPDAERLITEGVNKAPNAVYALVQTALVQDEALKRANARIGELQAQLGGAAQPQRQQGGFLDNMRDALFGRNEPHGSVPTVRPQTTPSATTVWAPGAEPQPGYPPPRPAAPAMTAPPSYAAGPTFGSGGSFLGTAASAAAGAIGGGLLLDGIRSMFGHRPGFAGDGPLAVGGHREDSVLAQSHLGDNNLARQAGIDDINQNYDDQGQQDRHDQQDDNDIDAASQSDDAFDTADADDDVNFADDDGSVDGDDTYDV